MKQVIVRYTVKPDKVAENEALIKDVFAELQRTRPEGLRYTSFKQDDGVSFVHIAEVSTADGTNPLSQSPAFQAFQAGIRDRCAVPPEAIDLDQIGAYNIF